jgi:hypothetical protein
MCANCHVVDLQVEIKDLQALKLCCEKLGWTFCEGQKTYAWWGHWVDDSPIPTHVFSEEEVAKLKAMPKYQRQAYLTQKLGHCQHAIKVPGSSYEIGVVEHQGQYKLVWDWAGGNLAQDQCATVPQTYGVCLAELTAQRQGQAYNTTYDENGNATVTIQINETQSYGY